MNRSLSSDDIVAALAVVAECRVTPPPAPAEHHNESAAAVGAGKELRAAPKPRD